MRENIKFCMVSLLTQHAVSTFKFDGIQFRAYSCFLDNQSIQHSVQAAGCWLLAAGCWLLVAGCWLVAAGCWLLVVGCWLLVAGFVQISIWRIPIIPASGS